MYYFLNRFILLAALPVTAITAHAGSILWDTGTQNVAAAGVNVFNARTILAQFQVNTSFTPTSITVYEGVLTGAVAKGFSVGLGIFADKNGAPDVAQGSIVGGSFGFGAFTYSLFQANAGNGLDEYAISRALVSGPLAAGNYWAGFSLIDPNMLHYAIFSHNCPGPQCADGATPTVYVDAPPFPQPLAAPVSYALELAFQVQGTVPTPEPGSLPLLALGLAAFLVLRPKIHLITRQHGSRLLP
jgi:hypothetical protein